jgi:maleylpyruvate isomerase
MDTREIDHHVAGCTAAHERLLDHLGERAAAGGRISAVLEGPSRLPGWSVGHVITHLARNADSFVRVIDGASRGEVLDQYVGGPDGRAAEIEGQAGRPAAEQFADLRRSIADLDEAWNRARATGWTGRWRGAIAGEQPIAELPFRRWREVEIHHADLGLPGFGFDDWSPRYVTEELNRRTMEWSARHPMGLTALPAAALALAPARRLAWLMGRETPAGLEPVRFA